MCFLFLCEVTRVFLLQLLKFESRHIPGRLSQGFLLEDVHFEFLVIGSLNMRGRQGSTLFRRRSDLSISVGSNVCTDDVQSGDK